MDTNKIKKIVYDIVSDARLLNYKHTLERDAPVNYACIFTQNSFEYEEMINLANKMGDIVKETTMGPVFLLVPITTISGNLRLVKIRKHDQKRPERGDADFTVADYETFKQTYLGKPGFSLIKREKMEMIELIDPSYNVLAYYSHPTLAEVLKLEL